MHTGKDHWEVLLRARGIENQCFVAAAAQFGTHNAKRSSYGRSLIIDPWGTVITCCGDTTPAIVSVPIDLERIDQVRSGMPVYDHR
jgi:predicted amidohydrolase